jgi:MFS family permease
MQPIVTAAFVRVWLASFATFTALGVALLATPLYARDALGARDLAIGVAIGASSVTAVFFGPLSGRVADRRGRRGIAAAGTLIMLAAFLALQLSPPLGALIAVRLFSGIGEAALIVALFTMVADLAPASRRGEAMSLITVAAYGGLAAGPVLADVVLGDGRFALVWLLGAGLTVAALALVSVTPETRPPGEEPPARLLPPRPALAPAFLLLLALIGFGGFNAFVALYAREVGARPGLVFALFGTLILLVRVLGRKIPDRFGPRPTTASACIAIAAGLTVMGGWNSAAGLFLGTAIFAFGQSLAYPAIVLLAMTRTPVAERSAAVGAVAAAVDVAIAAGAFTLGAAAELVGYGGAFLAAAVVAASGLLMLARLAAGEAAPALADAQPPAGFDAHTPLRSLDSP